eukprot:TRINITY_DN3005_c0_g1_i1.p1 TRINITY_DN3005_c0_g1~~TRINITY_DN3005_c0_g1_i1.p1  ORF type:complete len:391 (+),score=87.54 TRINITY_DN3005_c0_g1_i1:63-1175(+)
MPVSAQRQAAPRRPPTAQPKSRERTEAPQPDAKRAKVETVSEGRFQVADGPGFTLTQSKQGNATPRGGSSRSHRRPVCLKRNVGRRSSDGGWVQLLCLHMGATRPGLRALAVSQKKPLPPACKGFPFQPCQSPTARAASGAQRQPSEPRPRVCSSRGASAPRQDLRRSAGRAERKTDLSHLSALAGAADKCLRYLGLLLAPKPEQPRGDKKRESVERPPFDTLGGSGAIKALDRGTLRGPGSERPAAPACTSSTSPPQMRFGGGSKVLEPLPRGTLRMPSAREVRQEKRKEDSRPTFWVSASGNRAPPRVPTLAGSKPAPKQAARRLSPEAQKKLGDRLSVVKPKAVAEAEAAKPAADCKKKQSLGASRQ